MHTRRPRPQLVAIDLDDTLLEPDLTITAECVGALAAARAAGVAVVIATGRMFQSALPYARRLGLTSHLITYNGGLIAAPDGEALLHQPVPRAEARALVDVADREGLRLNFYIDDRLLVAEIDERVRYYQEIARVDAFEVGDLRRVLELGEPTKCLFVGEPDQVERTLPRLKAEFPALQIDRSKPRFIEVTRLGVHKFGALRALADSYGIPLEAVVAIGDSDNDITMLQGAGWGVAVSNASPAAKRAADTVTEHPRSLGVAEAVRRWVL